MTTIVTRAGKGSPLTWMEADTNFTNLNTDKAPINSPTFTGTVSGIGASNISLAPTGSISSTNVQAGIAELDSEKASLAGATFSGNVTVPKIQVGVSATANENHFWDGSVPNQLSLKRGTPDAPGAELIKALNGVLSFPNQGQSITANGYVKLPGGLIVQWLTVPGAASDNTFNFPIPFPTALLCAVATPLASQPGGGIALAVSFGTLTNTGGTVQPRYIDAAQVIPSSAPIKVIALGY